MLVAGPKFLMSIETVRLSGSTFTAVIGSFVFSRFFSRGVALGMSYHWPLQRLGSPEGELAVAQCVIYLATAPKSNAGYRAFGAAMRDAKMTGSLMPPKHILNAPTGLMKDLGYGDDYKYDHDAEDGFSGQNYFPDDMARRNFYQPVERGFERDIAKRLAYWEKLRNTGPINE